MSEGFRHNKGKSEISLVLEAAHAMNGVSKVLTFGKGKYSRGNWRKGMDLFFMRSNKGE